MKNIHSRFPLPRKTPEKEDYLLRATRVEKNRASRAVGTAIRKGTLIRPSFCEVCYLMCEPDAHHDHDDYAKPLTVRWLCDSCHRKWHAKNIAFSKGNPVTPSEAMLGIEVNA